MLIAASGRAFPIPRRDAGCTIPGDGTITVRVDSLGNTSDIFAVAGVMIRKDLTVAGSPHVSMLVMPSFSGRVKFRHRVTENGSIES
jgi:hypothetical protein